MPGISVEPPRTFTHHARGKEEGFNSVCHICFRTIAVAIREKDLPRLERKHECSPYDLAFQPKFGPH